MVVSNELNNACFAATARMLFELAIELAEREDVRLEFVNLGGGIGIPYRPDEEAVDLEEVSRGVEAAYDELIRPSGLDPLKVLMENGRVITGPYGYLVTRVIHSKNTYKQYVGGRRLHGQSHAAGDVRGLPSHHRVGERRRAARQNGGCRRFVV